MATRYSYDNLSPLHESQDIAEYVDVAWRTTDSPERDATSSTSWLTLPSATQHSYTILNRQDTADGSSLNSFRTEKSSSSSSSGLQKFKNGWEKNIVARVRRKPLPRYMQGSIRKHPAAEIEPTRVKGGVWKDQLLVDRSLRAMSVLTSAFAIAMLVVVATQAKAFGARANRFTSSVGGAPQDCHTATRTNTAVLLVVNVAATMVLGMSNTYQQLITSLQTSDLKYMLTKFGDSRVGTNSPWNINRKEKGKLKSWAAWLLLVCTSLPIHFLANSLIGPSYVIEPPPTVTFNETTYTEIIKLSNTYNLDGGYPISSPASFLCWSAFRTGRASFPHATMLLNGDLSNTNQGGVVYSNISISYSKENCSGLAGTSHDVDNLENTYKDTGYGYLRYQEGDCENGANVVCTMWDKKPAQCRLNVRMNAAFVLAAALSIKAIYMIVINFSARGRVKKQLLTFGDVIVASASHRELRVQGECMVNAKESYRRHCTHTCHKHCKSTKESRTGEEIGHCQKCTKWNSVNRFTNETQPTIATKIKRSLISNLGNTALTQMTIMTFCSIAMVAASIAAAVPVGLSNTAAKEQCQDGISSDPFCQMSPGERFASMSGGWGGFNRSLAIAALPPDDQGNEVLSFLISNGAQFIYSLLYLLLIYNITLVSQEYDWGRLEHERVRLRCTTVTGESFGQDYLLQLPKKILFPIMTYSVLTHWMLGEALQTQETIWQDINSDTGRHVEHSMYAITYAAYPLWIAAFLVLAMTGGCWWAFGYRREGVIPQMFGSIRVLCASTTQLDEFPVVGVKWGDLGIGEQFRHAGLSAEEVQQIIPNELYAGAGGKEEDDKADSCVVGEGASSI